MLSIHMNMISKLLPFKCCKWIAIKSNQVCVCKAVVFGFCTNKGHYENRNSACKTYNNAHVVLSRKRTCLISLENIVVNIHTCVCVCFSNKSFHGKSVKVNSCCLNGLLIKSYKFVVNSTVMTGCV